MTTELALLSRVSYRDREITSPRLRGLLALLAGDLRTGASTARLVDGLWPDEQPENPTKALQILVSRARAQLGAEVIVTTPTGYRLALGEDQVDASAVLLSAAASARSSRAGDHAAALAHAEAGLALWNGATADGAGTPDDPVSQLRLERAATHRSLLRARALALSRLGRRDEAVEPLAELARQRPRDEEILLELLRCEAATAGPAAALARYEAYRRALRDELGTDPGPALQALHRQLLDDEAPAVRHGIPHEPNPLLGRDDDIAAVAAMVRSSRVTSIVGPGGLGKTRLAHVVSRQAEQRFVHLVALAGVTTDEDVLGEVASVLGVGEARIGLPGGPRDVLPGIVEALGPGSALLVLDNCEHVIRGAAELVHALVSMTRELRVLTTSRAPLGLSSESVYLLPELSPPTCVELFAQRARAARPGVDLPEPVVSELCAHLDGLPLAVELAAARVRVMSVTEIAGRLKDRFSLLRGGSRDAPERHRTLQAVVDWSWNLLDEAGQRAMRALSIFPGGFTSAAAQRLVGDGEILEELVDQSLLKVIDAPSGTRFRMLETVREFSAARRDQAGETDPVVTDFLGWARGFGLAQHEASLSREPYAAIELIRAEQDNLLQAQRHAITRGDGATVAATAAVLGVLWAIESQYTRLTTMTEETGWLLSHFRPEPGLVEVTRGALVLMTSFAFALKGPHPARTLVALRRLPPAPPNTLAGAVSLVLVSAPDGIEAIHALCASDEPLVAGAANQLASYAWEGGGDLDSALNCARRSQESFAAADLPWLQATSRCRVAELCLQLERGGEARDMLLEALPVLDRLGAPDAAGLRLWIVLASLQIGAVDEAARWLASAPERIEVYSALGYALAVRAEVQLARDEIETGLRAWRRVVDQVRNAPGNLYPGIPAELDPWGIESRATAVVAHARHGRLDRVDAVAGELLDSATRILSNPMAKPPPYLMELPLAGTLLLALGMVDLARGEHKSGVRLIALAERFRFLTNFQPTMSSAQARRDAERADGPAYDEAVSSYAGLDRDQLRAAALTCLRDRG
ncbi:MAG TPA: BTAD domain-containing putative transcriptional regulator [Actinophytocola sp.]|uniref:ATP-binding protein n=1 Tax=Actinophytocola sp. TaxID=1872138 RepID=UPI002DDDA211|nr:BTAD domain-containing putative transcriptional regulator [Actinophytocola sp.]HEV2782542.1 BTAD domain-containing putative transcriptional regulator [Actinophytocola sp.]